MHTDGPRTRTNRLEGRKGPRVKKMSSESMIEKKKPACSHHSSRKRERVLAVGTMLLIMAAWAVGFTLEHADTEPYLYQAMPGADRIEKTPQGSYAAYGTDQLIGYISVGEGNGYGGPMNVAVATDLDGKITGLAVIRHRETPEWFKRVQESDYFSCFIGKKFSDPFVLGDDIDGISGATYTSRAVARASLEGSRFVAENNLDLPVPARKPAQVAFGPPEGVLLLLFALGFLGRRKSFRHKKKVRWLSMLTGMIILGFMYTNPLTLSLVNKMLLGFWPDWHTHLYWYVLLGGILFCLVSSGKNPYCEWFCPFGAAQECLGTIGGAKAHAVPRYKFVLMWLQRGLALAAILIAMVYRNPGISSYEIFGTLFDLKGSILQFFLLGLVVLASLFVRRPWCRYLCPIKPIESLIRFLRKWVKSNGSAKIQFP
ncbi:4Fe-4S binding domain-containing protein [Desulfoluna spongiiphila]|uniref:4Fe-4S binding domain-containing protein n=2 Tax=Desulfoluna spongiiphila TaxID=419481 RepID=A0A1G5C0P1_9BACT|nr:4Fe-4S binding domain-containing protein [Desulfoluna spongiiphila]